jgi:hypothetical protein
MTAATISDDPDTGETTLSWVAHVIHVMPTHYRKENR